jgi:ABC-type uncharacterized transport system ATPase component
MAKCCRRPKNFRRRKLVAQVRVSGKQILTCYKCGMKGAHSQRMQEAQERDSGNVSRPLVNSSQPMVQSTIGCLGEGKKDYLRLKLSISKKDDLLLLTHTEADLSPIKGKS